jgi:hypothetical protein
VPASEGDNPPFIKLPLAAVEPPRNVPAAQWNSPYCAHWEDGCTECKRGAISDAAQCHSEGDTGACARRAIICFKVIDDEYFRKVCRFYSTDNFFRGNSGTLYATSRFFFNDWRVSQKLQHSDKSWRYERRPSDGNLDNPAIDVMTENDGYISDVTLHKYDSDFPIISAFGTKITGIRCRATFSRR